MEPVRGFEPLTCGLRNRCSATELHRRQIQKWRVFSQMELNLLFICQSRFSTRTQNASLLLPPPRVTHGSTNHQKSRCYCAPTAQKQPSSESLSKASRKHECGVDHEASVPPALLFWQPSETTCLRGPGREATHRNGKKRNCHSLTFLDFVPGGPSEHRQTLQVDQLLARAHSWAPSIPFLRMPVLSAPCARIECRRKNIYPSNAVPVTRTFVTRFGWPAGLGSDAGGLIFGPEKRGLLPSPKSGPRTWSYEAGQQHRPRSLLRIQA